MKIVLIGLGIIILSLIYITIYCICAVASRCDEWEEQQLYGRSTKKSKTTDRNL